MKPSLLWIFGSLFGCRHQQLSRVFTIRKRTYRVCVECGREFEYSWELMHSIRLGTAYSPYEPLNSVRQTEVSAI